MSSSENLLDWVGDRTLEFRDSDGDGYSSLELSPAGSSRFYRVEEFLTYEHRSTPSDPPAFYQQQFLNAMAGFRSSPLLEEPKCLPHIGWDPTQASYWEQFNTTPAEHNENLAPNDPERRRTNFKLNDAEREKFLQNGFVVSPRIDLTYEQSPHGGYPNPIDYYYALWTDDLPVFITADSVLDAWHETFLRMLEEVEEFVLYPKLRELVIGLSDFTAIRSAWANNASPGAENVRLAIDDLNLYLGTAQRLLVGFNNSGPSDDTSSPVHWYQAARNHSDIGKRGLYGDRRRSEDMTVFTLRGHYTNSRVLTAYFQGFLWLSRAQFQIASSTPTAQSDRELRAAILLALQVRDKGLTDEWQFIESFVQTLNGQSDAMTVVEMLALLESLSLDRVTALTSDSDLVTIREALLNSNYGIQEIDGGTAVVDCNPVDYELPRALSLVGQRWTPDSWTLGKTVFPEVKKESVSVSRRVPSGLDVAYAVLGNNTALPILSDRMTDPNGVPFRDGYDYRENLDSARLVLDSQEPAFWTEHTYGSWLYSLRGLSETAPSSAPDVFRTEAWKRRVMNTQLVSWTQLRHDTLLYAEQSFTAPVLCEFPCGYVDPYPELWRRLSEMALQYKALLSPLNLTGSFWVEDRAYSGRGESPVSLQNWSIFNGLDPSINENQSFVLQVDRGIRIEAMCDHLENFSKHCLSLEAIARQQLDGLPHTHEMNEFIRDTVETFGSDSCAGIRVYSGWFPNLYFKTSFSSEDSHPSAIWKPVVADVHTDSADDCSGDPGGILHEGTGHSQFMLVAVNHADGTSCVYGGPVLSHYEFLEKLGTRLNDNSWERRVVSGDVPEPEDWKLDYLVPEQ